MKLTDRVYQELTHDERLHACMSAATRHDWDEVDRLCDTVKVVNMRGQNPGYFERMSRFTHLTLMHGVVARTLALGWFATLHQFTMLELPALAAGGATTDSESETPSRSEEVALTFSEITGRLKAHRDAWAEFCSDLDIDPAGMDDCAYHATAGQMADQADEYLEEVIERDEKYFEATLSQLRDSWDRTLTRVRCWGAGPEVLEPRKRAS